MLPLWVYEMKPDLSKTIIEYRTLVFSSLAKKDYKKTCEYLLKLNDILIEYYKNS